MHKNAKPTPSPWNWYQDTRGVSLATPDRGRLLVMDFVRLGMNGAQPRFALWEKEQRERIGGLMRSAIDLADINAHPDARLIRCAPEGYEFAKAFLAAYEDMKAGRESNFERLVSMAELFVSNVEGCDVDGNGVEACRLCGGVEADDEGMCAKCTGKKAVQS